MEEQIETRVSPAVVWQAWEKTHAAGLQGKSGAFKYQILQLVPNERFSIQWKTLFVRLVFDYAVHPTNRGSVITYDVHIQGFFAWAVRWFLEKKIRAQLRTMLKTFVRRLET